MNNIKDRIYNMEIHDYNPKISYLGSWGFNSLRTKLNIHKILPFNKEAFLHDKHYFLIWNAQLKFIMLLYYKLLVDYIFLRNCLKSSLEVPPIARVNCILFAFFCFCIVILFTPIYYFRYRNK